MQQLRHSESQPRLCIVGQMVGRNPGYVTTQGLILADLLRKDSFKITCTSSRLNRVLRLADVAYTLVRHSPNLDIQIIEVYSGLSFVLEDVASWLGKTLGLRVVMVLHGGALPSFTSRFPSWIKRVLDRADLIVTPSAYLARTVARCGYEARIIPNVIDLKAYPFRHRPNLKPRLFWMRSFHDIYNPGMAVRVLARLRTKLPEATLVMAGNDKGLEAETRRQADVLGLNGAIRFAGFLDLPGKLREADVADIFINTNHIDNTPVTVLEAAAMGLPVVSTSVGGLRDLLTDGETGLLVPDDNDRAMADAIERLVGDPDLAEQLSRNGRCLAEHYSWERVKADWESVFEELMQPSLAGEKVA